MVGFIEINGQKCAGKHLLIDMWGCSENLKGNELLEVCKKAAISTGATILFSHFHNFENSISSSGVVILAESHITFHTFLEKDEGNYISIDVYVCGNCDPFKSVPVFEEFLKPEKTEIKLEFRGLHN